MIVYNKMVFYSICFTILAIVFFVNIKIDENNSFLNKFNTDSFRGVAIVCIIFHHVIQQIKNPGVLMPFRGIGYLFVSYFFFLSGYGLAISYLNKDNYLKDFFRKRMSKIYIPFLFVNLINLLINIVIFNKVYTFFDFIKSLIGIELMSCAMWYIIAIIFWYITFYFVFSYIKKINKIIIILFSISLIWFIICNSLGISKNWYDTAFIFPIGVFVGLKKDFVKNQILKNYNMLLILSFVVFIVLFLINFGKVDTISIIIRAIAAITFIIFFIILLIKIDLSRNKVSFFLGTISFELFLIYDRLLNILDIGGKVTGMNLILYFIIIVILSYILNNISKYTNSKLFR